MKRLLMVLVLVGLMAGAAFASAAYLNVQAGSLGAGSATVGGFTVSEMSWHTKFTNGVPSSVEAAFNISPEATRVYASLEGVENSQTSCTAGTAYGTDWSCSFSVDPAKVTKITIVAEN